MNPWEAFDEALKPHVARALEPFGWRLEGKRPDGLWYAARGRLLTLHRLSRPNLALLVAAIEQEERERPMREGFWTDINREGECDCDP